MRVWRGLAATGVWLLAVAVVAGVAWFAIDSAGHEVGGDGVVSLVAAPRSAPAAPLPASSSPSPSATPATSATSPAPTGSTPVRDVAPSSPPSSPASSRPTARPGGTATTRPTPAVPGTGTGATATFTSSGGDLVVRCSGTRVEGWNVRPADDWRSDPKLVGRQELQVVFTSGDDAVIEVRAVCRESGASFSAQSRSRQP